MKILNARQKAVLAYVQRHEVPTVREIADGLNLNPSSVRTALMSLQRDGCVEQRGVAFSGGATWAALVQH